MDEEGEEPFVALDSLLEVNLVEDPGGCGTTPTKEGSVKNYGQEGNQLAEDAVNSCVNYSKTTGLDDSRQYSNLDAVQIAWGMDMEEDTFYKDLFKDVSVVQFLRLHCTVCDTHLGCKPGSVLMRHVRLGTLLCKHCFTFYGSGEFPVAEDGSESFCYWCGQGGSVICCSSCSAVFCKKCIKLNYSKSTIKEIESSLEWLCFVCNYRSLWEHRAVCRAAITYESSDHGALKGDEGNDTPGHNQDFCCGPAVERRIPRLKSSMPSEVTFIEYIKAGKIKACVMKMLRTVSATENASDSVSLHSTFETEKIIKGDSQNKILTHSAASKETVSSEQSVPANHSNKARADASHNIPHVGIGPPIGQTRFPSFNSQPTTGLNFLNQGIRSNIINNSQGIPSGRVVVMPPVHIPHRTSVLRFPAVGAAATAQQNPPADGLSLGALLSSSPPVGSVPQKQNPLFPFQNGTPPFVVVSNSNIVPSVPVVVRNSNGAYVPMYVNNSANLHYIPKESSQISRVPHYVQSQGTNARVSHPNQQQEKFENNATLPHSSAINSAATHQPNINSSSSQNVPEAYTAKTCANSTTTVKSKTKRGYIQVRSPTALQSVTVSDIEHSPLTVSEPVTQDVSEQQSIHNPLLPSCSSENVPSAPTLLARDYNSFHTESHAKSYRRKRMTDRITPSTTISPGTSVLKKALTEVSHTPITSDKVAGSSNPINGTFSSEEISEANVVDQTPKLPSRGIDDIRTNWFRENLVEAENVAKYMLTRITCVQEELDSKSHQKQAYDDMVHHFSKFIEIANKKLKDVSRKFSTNFQRWKALSASNHANLSQESCVNADKQSSVETNNGQINSAVDEHNYTVSREEVEIISVKVRGKGNRKRSRSESQISPPVTCTTETSPRIATTQDATCSDTCTDSSETASHVAKPTKITYQPVRMSTRRSRINRVNTKSVVKCCSSCDSNVSLRNKRVDFQQNVGSSCSNSDRVPEQDKYIHIPEKRRKLKELRIVLERIQPPLKMVIKRELDDNNVIDHSINDSNAQSLEDVAVVKDQSYLGPDILLKQLKPCSVVIQRLTQREITHCI